MQVELTKDGELIVRPENPAEGVALLVLGTKRPTVTLDYNEAGAVSQLKLDFQLDAVAQRERDRAQPA